MTQAPSPSFSIPTRILSGLRVSSTLAEHIHALRGTRVALVGDEGLAKIGVLQPFAELITAADGVELVNVTHSDIDPGITAADELAVELNGLEVDLIVGVGGGSALSLAKGAALAMRNPDPLITYAYGIGLAPNRPVPTIAIPTTAGSGAEVSSTFVLYDTANVRSIGFTGPGYEPEIALLDGELLTGLPERPMRDAALDAYSHAFEALWGRRATTFSTASAFEALRLIREYLPRALADRRPEDLQVLLEASSLANIACGNAGLGLVHAMTGASAIHVSHGRQNGIVLPVVAEFNRPMLSEDAVAEIELIEKFYAAVGADSRFNPGELPEGAAESIVAAAQTSPLLANNIRSANEDELRELAIMATTI